MINAVEICDFGGGGRGRIVFAPASSQEREGGRWFSIVNLGSQTDSAAMSMKQTMQQLSGEEKMPIVCIRIRNNVQYTHIVCRTKLDKTKLVISFSQSKYMFYDL